jgi:hypothetical protein
MPPVSRKSDKRYGRMESIVKAAAGLEKLFEEGLLNVRSFWIAENEVFFV